jgi:tetraacyldisaccharide 4'-kinase
MYDRGQLKANELRGPVVSIGNISVGGSGKTPFTILLGTLLRERGIPFDILSRGYGRLTRGAMIVDPNGSSRDFGDEPLLMSRELGADVVVGESRFAAGQLSENTWGPRLHLLDDGFQHRRLRRQIDIVLVSPEDLTGTLLPSGRLREPLSSLSRADAVVITGDTSTETFPPHLPIWRITRELSIATEHSGGRSPSTGADNCGIVHPVVFCGIAKPQNFFAQVRSQGIAPVAEIAFRDHHRYTAADVQRLQNIARDRQADSFLTTSKDAINLEPIWPKQESGPGLRIARLQVSMENTDAALDTTLRTLRDRGKPAS